MSVQARYKPRKFVESEGSFLLVRGRLEDSRLDNLDLHVGTAVGADGSGLNLANDLHSLNDTAENGVLAIEPSGLDSSDEEFYKWQ